MRILLVVGGRSRREQNPRDRRHARKLRTEDCERCEARLRKERNKELTSKGSPIDLTPLPKTHKLAIDLISPITANSPPDPPSHFQNTTNSTKMSSGLSRSTSAAGSSGRTGFSIARLSPSAMLPINYLANNANNEKQFIKSLALTIAQAKMQLPLRGTMGALVFGAVVVTKFIEAYPSHSSRTRNDPLAEYVIPMFPYYCSETIQ